MPADNDQLQRDYVTHYTDASFIVKEESAFHDGLYSGYDVEKRSYDRSSWDYEIGEDGFARVDPTLAHPRCVLNLMKQHYSRYSPELVERICGTPKEGLQQICEMIASTATPTRALTILYALGWTPDSVGSQMIRCAAMVQLLLGNIGVSGGGMNALRGHSNIHGLALADASIQVRAVCDQLHGSISTASAGIGQLIGGQASKQVPVPRQRRSVRLEPTALCGWHGFTTKSVLAGKARMLQLLLDGGKLTEHRFELRSVSRESLR